MQVRNVNEFKEVWDVTLKAWRPAQPLDQIKEEKQTQDRFVCGGCGEKVEVKIHYSGWEWEAIDPETGEERDVIDAERTDIHDREYFCSEGCGWSAGTEWYDDIKYAEYKAQEKEEAKVAPWLLRPTLEFTGTFEPF